MEDVQIWISSSLFMISILSNTDSVLTKQPSCKKAALAGCIFAFENKNTTCHYERYRYYCM